MTGRCKSRGRGRPSLPSLRRSKKSLALQMRDDDVPPKPYTTAPTLPREHKPARTKTSSRRHEARGRKDTRRGRARQRTPHTPLSPIKEGEEKHPFGRRGTESTRSSSSSGSSVPPYSGFRPDYQLSDPLRSPHHVLSSSAREARQAAGALQNHDYAFVRRSDGSCTYAVLAYRSYEADVAAECLHFVIDDSGATKMVPEWLWGTCVCLVSDEGVEEECFDDDGDSVEQEAPEQSSAEPNKLLNSLPMIHRNCDEANTPSREENERAATWPCVACTQEFASYTMLAEHACQATEEATNMECDGDDCNDGTDGSDCSDDMTFVSARSVLSEHVIEAEPLVADDICVGGTEELPTALQTPTRPRRRVSDVSVHSPFYGEDIARQIEDMAAAAEERRRSIRSAEGERELATEHSNRAEEDVRASNEEELGFDVSQSDILNDSVDAVTDIDQSFVFGDMPAIPSLQEASTKEATDSALAWSALGVILGSPAPTSARKKRRRRPVNLWQEDDGSACDDLERVILPSEDDDELGMGEKRMNPMCRTSSMPDLVLDESANDDCSIPSICGDVMEE